MRLYTALKLIQRAKKVSFQIPHLTQLLEVAKPRCRTMKIIGRYRYLKQEKQRNQKRHKHREKAVWKI